MTLNPAINFLPDGNLFTEQVAWMELQFPSAEKIKFVRQSKMGHAHFYEHLQDPKVNICCLTIIPLSEELRPTAISERLPELGDSAILIYDTERFYDTIEKSLSELGFTYEMKPVKYYNHKEHNGDLTFFDKDIDFSYQNEYRILIWPNPEGDLKIPVPGLKKMSVVVESIKIPELKIEFINSSSD